jgi:hypothetical protein
LPKQGDSGIKQRFHNLCLFDALEDANIVEGQGFHRLSKEPPDRIGESKETVNLWRAVEKLDSLGAIDVFVSGNRSQVVCQPDEQTIYPRIKRLELGPAL